MTPDEPIYICLGSNTTTALRVEAIPNLVLPDQESFPTKEDAEDLQYALFKTNSKLMELINQHVEFGFEEQKGHEANLLVDEGLRNLMLVEVVVIIVIATLQFFILRRFANNVKLR